MTKRIIAREWLFALTGVLAGIGLMFLARPMDTAGLWTAFLFPYLLFMLIRSVVWAVRTLRSPKVP